MKKYQNIPIWLLWRKEERDGKPTKIPYQSPGKYASSTDPNTWSTYTHLKKTYFKDTPTSGEKGIGIVFEDHANIIGVDFDHCVTDGVLHPDVEKFIKEAGTYVEYSPSGTGVHLLFEKTEQIDLVSNKHHFDTYSIEVYTSGRYFTFTENELPQSREARQITSAELTALLETLGYPWKRQIAPQIKSEVTLEDSQVLERMFRAKNGVAVKSLWEGDVSAYDNDISRADHILCMHLAFWTGKDYAQMERLWLSSPLGQREKTQRRDDYRARTLTNAISSTSEVYTPMKREVQKIDGEDFDFILSGGNDPKPLLIFPNILRVIRKDPYFTGMLRKNDFSHLTEYKNDRGVWVSLNDDFISEVREYITEHYPSFVRLSKEMTTEAILRAACDNRVNPPRDYVSSLVWDQVPRLNSWIHNTYGTPDDEVHQAIGSNWLKGLVKRIIQPGCQFDEVLALESPQGYRKSTSLRVLGAPWHVETTHSIDNKDFYLLLAQNVIVEFSEGEIMDRASVNKLKAEITKTEDQLRPPYERGMVKFLRSCVFAITTNRLELKDDTGNRRWLPVQLQRVANIDWLQENKDQLYAEAYYRVIVRGETTHEYPNELYDLQENKQEYSANDERILEYLERFDVAELETEGFSLNALFEYLYGDKVRMGKLEEIQLGGSLRKLHMDNERRFVKGKRVRRWVPSPKGIEMLKEIKKQQNEF